MNFCKSCEQWGKTWKTSTIDEQNTKANLALCTNEVAFNIPNIIEFLNWNNKCNQFDVYHLQTCSLRSFELQNWSFLLVLQQIVSCIGPQSCVRHKSSTCWQFWVSYKWAWSVSTTCRSTLIVSAICCSSCCVAYLSLWEMSCEAAIIIKSNMTAAATGNRQ